MDGYYCAWQFNFREFNIHEDVYAQDSIELLRHSGIDFKAHSERGIDVHKFGELLMARRMRERGPTAGAVADSTLLRPFQISGVVLSDTVRWITFHSGCGPPSLMLPCSHVAAPVLTACPPYPSPLPPTLHPHLSYDFGYLLKLVTCRELPATESEFFDILLTYFPTIYDMKYLQKFVGGPQGLHGGLQKLADALDVERIGPQHQAGSDSLLTANTFFKMRNVYFSGQNSGTDAPLHLDKYANVLYGLGIDGKALDEEGNAAD